VQDICPIDMGEHDWQPRTAKDGTRYDKCLKCGWTATVPKPKARYPGDLGKDDDSDGSSFHHMTHPMTIEEARLKVQSVVIDYTNWKGNRRMRHIDPSLLAFCANEYHRVPQWMILATDLEDTEHRGLKAFPLANIHSWTPAHALPPKTGGEVVGGKK
jgi:hypothetical protein